MKKLLYILIFLPLFVNGQGIAKTTSSSYTFTGDLTYELRHGEMVQKYMDNLVVGDDISFYIMNITDNNDPTIISTYVYVRKEY